MTNSTLFQTHSAFFGLDVHKKTISIAICKSFGEPEYLETLLNDPRDIKDFFQAAIQEYDHVFAIYEAGGCGFVLYRQLEAMGGGRPNALPVGF